MIYHRGLLIVALSLAFFLRVWGLDFGLPYEFHPDEHFYVDPVLAWHVEGEVDSGLDPSLFSRLPFKYVLLAGYGLWLVVSPYEPSEQWLTTAWFFARFWSVIFGVLTVALAYPVGKRLYGVRGGILAMVIMSGLFLPVRESHFVVPDAAVTFFMLLAIYLSVLLFWRRRWGDFLVAGIVVGIAATTKLVGWFTVVAVFTAYVLTFGSWGKEVITQETKEADRIKELKYLGLSFLTGVSILLFISVRSLKDLPDFVTGLINLLRVVPNFYTSSFKGMQMAPVTGWQFYINVLGWGVGWLLVGVIIWAIGSVCWRRYRPGIVLVIFSLVFFWYIGSRTFLFARFLLPIVPPLIIVVAGELNHLKVDRLMGQRYQMVFWGVLIGVLLAQPLSTSIWFDYLLTLPDTREKATEWVIKEFPPDTVITKERYSMLPNMLFLTKRWPFMVTQLNEYGAKRNHIDFYVAHKTDLIALSNFTSARVRQDSNEEAARLAQQAMLNQKANLIKTFNPYRDEEHSNRWFYLDELYGPAGETLLRKQPGPLIKIYRLPYQNQPYSLEMPPIPVPVKANFADKMMLLGYDMPLRRSDPGGAIPLTLYWQALSRMNKNYVIFNRLLDSQQHSWGGYDRWPQEVSKTTLWRTGEVVIDTFNIPVASNAPDGVYTIDIGLYAQDDPQGISLPLLQNGIPIDKNSIRLGPVKIGGPLPEVTLSAVELKPHTELKLDLGEPPVIQLQGYDLTYLNNMLNLTLYWKSLAQTPLNWSIFIHVRDESGETVAQKDGPAGSGKYPTSLWDAGEIISDSLIVPLDALVGGHYSIVVGLYNIDTGERLLVPNSQENAFLLDQIEIER